MIRCNYLDCAATSFPKPRDVTEEAIRCLRTYGGNPGRGSHKMALLAAEKVYEARKLCASLVSCKSPERVAFTMNATYALNTAILSLVPEGAHVLISDLEHNSVLRPVEHLCRTKGVAYDVFSTSGDVLENVKSMIRKNTRALICTHASNITNAVLPIEDIGRELSRRGITFIVDASQSAGRCRIDMESAEIDALCFPGHKGLLSPQGVGVLVLSERAEPEPLVHGGSGAQSRLPYMPRELPDRLEAGTLPTPAIAGLCKGVSYVMKRGEARIFESEREIIKKISSHFENERRISVYSRGEGAIWLFNIRGIPSQTTSRLLDERGVCTRPGLHCAPLAHRTLKTPEDGAVRVSAGALTEPWQADHFIRSLEDILRLTMG